MDAIGGDAECHSAKSPRAQSVVGFDSQPATHQAHDHRPLQAQMQGDDQQRAIGGQRVGLTRSEAGAHRQKAEDRLRDDHAGDQQGKHRAEQREVDHLGDHAARVSTPLRDGPVPATIEDVVA